MWLSRDARAILDGIERTGRFVFPSPLTGRPRCGDWLEGFWREVRAEAGIPDVRIHDLRHTCAAYLSNQLFLLILFFCYKIRKQIVTGVDRIPGAACSASRATPAILRIRAIPAIAGFVAGLRYPGGSVSTMS